MVAQRLCMPAVGDSTQATIFKPVLLLWPGQNSPMVSMFEDFAFQSGNATCRNLKGLPCVLHGGR